MTNSEEIFYLLAERLVFLKQTKYSESRSAKAFLKEAFKVWVIIGNASPKPWTSFVSDAWLSHIRFARSSKIDIRRLMFQKTRWTHSSHHAFIVLPPCSISELDLVVVAKKRKTVGAALSPNAYYNNKKWCLPFFLKATTLPSLTLLFWRTSTNISSDGNSRISGNRNEDVLIYYFVLILRKKKKYFGFYWILMK